MVTYSAAILELGRRQHSTLNFSHLITHAHTERLEEGVGVEVGAPDEVVDLALAVGRRASGRLDHGGRLHVSELLHAALTSHDVAHLERQVRVLLLLTHLQAGQVRVLQTHTVALEKVLGHGALYSLTGVELERKPVNNNINKM